MEGGFEEISKNKKSSPAFVDHRALIYFAPFGSSQPSLRHIWYHQSPTLAIYLQVEIFIFSLKMKFTVCSKLLQKLESVGLNIHLASIKPSIKHAIQTNPETGHGPAEVAF
jgi:hypothetical protein